MKKNKESHYVMIKGSIHEDVTILSLYTLNSTDSNYMKKKTGIAARRSRQIHSYHPEFLLSSPKYGFLK